jgi:hypothetical protein
MKMEDTDISRHNIDIYMDMGLDTGMDMEKGRDMDIGQGHGIKQTERTLYK